jgi:hypothetical protein
MVRKRLFIHPTFDCSFDKVCRDDCYLLKDKSDTDKMFRLPDSYWVEIVRAAGEHGFEELSMPINPLRGVTGVKDPLYWLQLLAPIAKEYNMIINITTTLNVVDKIRPEHGVDIIAISIDEYRASKDWARYAKKVTKSVTRLQDMNIETNCNLSVSKDTIVSFLANYEMRNFLMETFDYTTTLWPKPLNLPPLRVASVMRLGLIHSLAVDVITSANNQYDPDYLSGQDVYSSALEALSGDAPGFLIDYCMSYVKGDSQCDAGHGQLSIDAFGRIAICPYSQHSIDVSTLEKFNYYLEEIVPRAGNISLCTLMEENENLRVNKYKRLPHIGKIYRPDYKISENAIVDLHW